MTDETPVRTKPAKSRKFLLVRYGRMKILGVFEHSETEVPRTPTRVVVKTDKGLEMGDLVGQLSHYKDGRFRLSEEQLASYYVTSEIQFNTEPVGKVVRCATPDDISEEQHLQQTTGEEIESCERIAHELGLRMKIIDAEHIFGGERIVFYFMAEGRVDFRDLVRKLAQEYQTRIEMRQIGSRDEAKLLGDVESCGRECCCLQFLQLLKPVNMRMAKMQKATLDPSKISGYCGRLKCCLRYEDQTYTELKQSLPKRGVFVQTDKGEAKVIDGQILTQLVVVEFENGDKASYRLDEVTILPPSAVRRRPPQQGEGPANANPREGASSGPPGRDARRPGRDRPGRDPRPPVHNGRPRVPQEPLDGNEEPLEPCVVERPDRDEPAARQGERPADRNRREGGPRDPSSRESRRSGRHRRGRYRPPRDSRPSGGNDKPRIQQQGAEQRPPAGQEPAPTRNEKPQLRSEPTPAPERAPDPSGDTPH